LGGTDGMGVASVRPPGMSGLTFDHVLSRLQGELQKSCETGAELYNLIHLRPRIQSSLSRITCSTIPSTFSTAVLAPYPPKCSTSVCLVLLSRWLGLLLGLLLVRQRKLCFHQKARRATVLLSAMASKVVERND
jgi:hypothetical protein